MRKYWMVHCARYGVPRQEHGTRESAQQEAQRLAARHPGDSYVVLEAVECWSAPQPVAQRVGIVEGADDE